MPLKKYQEKSIEELKSYLKEIETLGAKRSFVVIKETPYKSEFFREIPFICMKLPTGGGKTLVGCHSIVEIMNSVLKNKLDKGIVMWFVPSEAIKSQTLKKFKDRNDMHRKILDESFDNNIRVFSNEEALGIRKEDVGDNLCIVISSLEAFRKEKTLQNKYKVYRENGLLIGHFENLNSEDKLEKDVEGTVINSLSNVIRKHNPLIIIDEGHRTKTKLSIEFLRELNPSFILEYTATPREESNVLVDIHSSELKDEEMVKIPIVLESSVQWQNAINRGVLRREELDKEAKKNKKEYIRPIALLQAQQEKESDKKITVGQIKEFLIKEKKIPEDEIAIKTSSQNQIEGINLFSKKCKIKYIITVNALAEGWDCSFAYVLISVANIGSKIAVEQVIGRIIRMPNVKRKDNEALNRSYVFTSAKNFNEAADTIINGLKTNGYDRTAIINATNPEEKYELEVEKRFNEKLSIPVVTYKEDYLSFEDLVGEDFELSKEDFEFEFDIHFDNDGRAIIDIQGEDDWIRGAQQILNLTYKDKNFSEDELIQWIDKKLRFKELDKSDKVKFIKKVVQEQLKKRSLSDLSVNRYIFASKLSDLAKEIMQNYTKKKFDNLLEKGEIKAKGINEFPDKIILKSSPTQEWNKSYYNALDGLNKEETRFIQRLDLDGMPNIKYWVRSREKKDPFYIQGWKKNKFYPDFIAITKKGNIVALEWKGEDRMSNEDTAYKIEIGKMWESLDKNLKFFIVNNNNIETVLEELKKL